MLTSESSTFYEHKIKMLEEIIVSYQAKMDEVIEHHKTEFKVIITEHQTTLTETIKDYQSQLEIYKKRCEQYAVAYDSLQNQIRELLRHRFGKKSERFIDPEQHQLSIFGDNESIFAAAELAGEALDNDIQVASYTRKNKAVTKTLELPRRIEIIPLSAEQRLCACGKCRKVIRYESREILNHQPAVFEIIEQRREVGVCLDCEGSLATAPAPLQVLPKVRVTEEFLSFLVVSKLDDRQPLYHLEKQLYERYGVDCSRQSMARWLIELMEPLQPIYNLLKDEIIDYDVASCDATTLQVLKEPGRPAEKKSYVYCMRGGPPGREVILYGYNDKLHKAFVADWFEGFNGYLHVDGDNFFESIGEKVQLVNCNAHSRRKFVPIALSTKGKGIAKQALHIFKQIYKIERQAKEDNLTSEQRYALRQEKTKPIMEQFKSWLDEIYPTVLPQSPLGKAINYCLKLWSGLICFLDDGRLEIDNNLTEQEIKPFVISRKNFLFAATVDGAKALCMHLGFIRTAKRHGLEPYHYYVKLLKSIPHCKSVEDYEKLLPWNIQLDYENKASP